MRVPSVRLLLILQLAALAVVSATLLLAVGLPLLARRALTPATFAALVLGAGAITLGAGAVLMVRSAAAPVERLLMAAERLGLAPGAGPELPILGESGGHGLARAAVAFERVAGALAEERARLAAKVQELTRTNRCLAEARESLLQTEKLATVGRLAAGLAHEVGNPLGAITGFVEIARARLPEDGDPVLRDAVERIGVAAERIDRTVRGLLEFSRPSAPCLGVVELPGVVEGALRLARVQSRFKHVAAELSLPADLPPVWADEHGLGQVLLNVLLNAGDATARGKGNVRICARAEGEPDGRVVIEIADDGPGIQPADLSRVFDPFFTTKEPGAGTGLGLAVSHGILASIGGDIAAGNSPGGGAVFTIRLLRAGTKERS